MRTRSLTAAAAVALALGLLTALPASAAYQDPRSSSRAGPACSTRRSPARRPSFTFDADTNDATFELRLRRVGGPAIRTREVFIDPDTMASPRPVTFSWPALSVGSAKTYQVAVYRGGNLQGSPESFQVLPPLVSITGATPNPFLPWIDDDIKDETRISYTLEAPPDRRSSVSTAPTRTGSAAAPSCSSRTTGRTRQGSTSTSGTAGPRNREGRSSRRATTSSRSEPRIRRPWWASRSPSRSRSRGPIGR